MAQPGRFTMPWCWPPKVMSDRTSSPVCLQRARRRSHQRAHLAPEGDMLSCTAQVDRIVESRATLCDMSGYVAPARRAVQCTGTGHRSASHVAHPQRCTTARANCPPWLKPTRLKPPCRSLCSRRNAHALATSSLALPRKPLAKSAVALPLPELMLNTGTPARFAHWLCFERAHLQHATCGQSCRKCGAERAVGGALMQIHVMDGVSKP